MRAVATQGFLSRRTGLTTIQRIRLISTQGFIPYGKIDQTLNYPLQISLNTGRTFIQTNTGKKFIKIEEM